MVLGASVDGVPLTAEAVDIAGTVLMGDSFVGAALVGIAGAIPVDWDGGIAGTVLIGASVAGIDEVGTAGAG